MDGVSFKKISEVFDAGYCLPLYSISLSKRYWEFKKEVYITGNNIQIYPIEINNDKLNVAKITEVRDYNE